MKQNASVEAYLDSYDLLTVEISRRYYDGLCEKFYVRGKDGKMIHCRMMSNEEFDLYRRYILELDEELEFSKKYDLVVNQGYRAPIQFRYIVQTERFDQEFYYDKDDLGAIVTEGKTDFALWAPTASAVMLWLKRPDGGEISMQRDEKGVWRAHVDQDLTGTAYTYLVHVNGTIRETVDPYGKSSTANGADSVVVNLDELRRKRTPSVKLNHPVDAVIYELSIRDMTSSTQSGTHQHGTFAALSEKGTYFNGQSTGFDYLCDLGITHVQMMPVNDFYTVDEYFPENQYNWGYDPHQYMTLEGSYSSDPNDGLARVREFLHLVNCFHEAGIGVNLDVVFNHHYDVGLSCFESCVPYYYFRVNSNKSLSNGSFCGNDLESRRRMYRKYILDTCTYFVEFFGIDGFRFDLMGILDIETMKQLEKKLRHLNPSILLYGEGWNLPTALPDEEKCMTANQNQVKGIAFFNDYYRDHLKGRTSEYEKNHRGYLTGDEVMLEASKYCLCAMAHPDLYHYFDEPGQSVNYVECHDNATLWDKMRFCCNDEVREIRIKRQKMINAAVLFSQGIPFIHSGQEFCRTKYDYDNTYNMPDRINAIDWARRNRNAEVVRYFKDCVRLRRSCAAFRLRTSADLKKYVQFENLDSILVYKLCGVGELCDYDEVAVFINPFKEDRRIHSEGYVCILDENGRCHRESDNLRLPAYSLHVLVKLKKENG